MQYPVLDAALSGKGAFTFAFLCGTYRKSRALNLSFLKLLVDLYLLSGMTLRRAAALRLFE